MSGQCNHRVLSRFVSESNLLLEMEALVTALLGDALPAQITAVVDRLEAAADYGDGMPPAMVDEVRAAVRLVRNGQPCAGISALLSVRTGLGASPH
jgi:hypothetical protein